MAHERMLAGYTGVPRVRCDVAERSQYMRFEIGPAPGFFECHRLYINHYGSSFSPEAAKSRKSVFRWINAGPPWASAASSAGAK